MVRGAGFPASMVELLSAPQLAKASDTLLELQERSILVFASVAEKLQLQNLRPSKSRSKLFRALQSLRIPTGLRDLEGGDALLAKLETCLANTAAAQAEFEQCFKQDDAVVVRNLAELANIPAFIEAVTWQNPKVAALALPKVREARTNPNRSYRKSQRTAASYLQRYCLKNDTIGFFGPVGWGTFNSEGPRFECGPKLLAARAVFFEDWAIHALASLYSDHSELLKWARPRPHSAVRLEGTTLQFAGRGTASAPEFVRRIVAACDGRTGLEIAMSLASEADNGFEDEDDVFEALEQLVEEGVLIWRFEIPSVTGRALFLLRDQMACIDTEAGRNAVADLDRLDALRQGVAKAAGRPGDLKMAMQHLQEAFEEISGQRAERNSGQSYAGRTIAYEDCLRDHQLAVGPEFLDAIREPMRETLDSARWFLSEATRRYQKVVGTHYRALAAKTGEPEVELIALLRELIPVLSSTEPGSLIHDLENELREKWASILQVEKGARRVHRASADLADQIAQHFASALPATPRGVFQAPDVMVAGRSAEDVLSGNGLFVLGEVHVGGNTIAYPCTVRWHPEQEAIAKAFHADVGDCLVEPVGATADVTRADPVVIMGEHYEIEMGESLSRIDSDKRWLVGNLVVEEAADGLVVRDRASGKSLPAIAVLESQLTAALTGAFAPFGGLAHNPRVTIDKLVVCREQWSFSAPHIPVFPETRGPEQFLAVRKWARTLEMPSLLFYKSRQETKPAYLDLDSPLLVENFVTICAKSTKLTVSEMLPSPDEAWLRDSEGHKYTSELRFVMVDSNSWSPSPQK